MASLLVPDTSPGPSVVLRRVSVNCPSQRGSEVDEKALLAAGEAGAAVAELVEIRARCRRSRVADATEGTQQPTYSRRSTPSRNVPDGGPLESVRPRPGSQEAVAARKPRGESYREQGLYGNCTTFD
jgi:hypothetical protein